MADSNNSMSLSFVTRRRLLTGTAIVTLAWPFQGSAIPAELHGRCDSDDPVFLLWEEWKAAALKTEALCHMQQRLETELAKSVGFPRAAIRLPDNGEKVTVFSLDAIGNIFDSNPHIADRRGAAEAEFAAHQARWDAAGEHLGYAAAKRAEQEASNLEQELVDAMTFEQATSLAGVAGKLDMVLYEGETSEECTEFPWSHIRSALCDLVRIGRAMELGVLMPGNDRHAPVPQRAPRGALGAGPLILSSRR